MELGQEARSGEEKGQGQDGGNGIGGVKCWGNRQEIAKAHSPPEPWMKFKIPESHHSSAVSRHLRIPPEKWEPHPLF